MRRWRSASRVRAGRVPAPPSARKAEDNLFRLAGGSSLVFFGGWVAYVLSLAFHVVVARQVGASSFGTFTLGLTATTVLAGIAPLGRDQAVVRYVASPPPQTWCSARCRRTPGGIHHADPVVRDARTEGAGRHGHAAGGKERGRGDRRLYPR
jgi:hypothetical protein